MRIVPLLPLNYSNTGGLPQWRGGIKMAGFGGLAAWQCRAAGRSDPEQGKGIGTETGDGPQGVCRAVAFVDESVTKSLFGQYLQMGVVEPVPVFVKIAYP